VERRVWNRFQGEDVGGWLPDYTFTASWPMPTWWLTSVGGTWTLSVQDEEMHCLGPKPTNVSWCLTPLDPAIHASAPVDDPLSACASATGSIGDCDAESCPVTTVFEMQVSDIVRASGTPTLALSMSHENPSDLEIAFTCANGFEQTLWDRGSGTIPGSFDLTGMTGEWMTGRYQLLVRDNVIGDGGSVSSWCVNAN
jgi:subtilisin-like proprotein convertase family protein